MKTKFTDQEGKTWVLCNHKYSGERVIEVSVMNTKCKNYIDHGIFCPDCYSSSVASRVLRSYDEKHPLHKRIFNFKMKGAL